MTTGLSVQDLALQQTAALPNGAAATTTTGFDLGLNASGQGASPAAFLAKTEFQISAPALTTSEMPDGKTMSYRVEHSADNSSWSTLYDNVGVQTGAGGVGCGAISINTRLPLGVKRYVRAKATGSGAGNASPANMTAALVF